MLPRYRGYQPIALGQLPLRQLRYTAPPAPRRPQTCCEGSSSGTPKAQRAGTRKRREAAPVVSSSSALRSAPSSSASLSRPVPSSTATRSPGARSFTFAPTFPTTPTASRPGTMGSKQGPQSPRHCCASAAFKLHACTVTSTASEGRGLVSSYVKDVVTSPGTCTPSASERGL